MAKKEKTVAAAPLDMALLASISAATQVAPFYMNAPISALEPLRVAGLVEVNPDTSLFVDGNPAARISPAGTEKLAAAGSAPAAAPAAAPVAKTNFAVVKGFTMPEAKRVGGTGGARPEVYPFSSLEIGDAFFIPATAEKPNPEKTFASTVASATQRYAVADTTKPMKANRKGNMAHPKNLTRKFAIRRVEDGAQFGFPGVAGAAVGRLPLPA